jgi:hypothetical protein
LPSVIMNVLRFCVDLRIAHQCLLRCHTHLTDVKFALDFDVISSMKIKGLAITGFARKRDCLEIVGVA